MCECLRIISDTRSRIRPPPSRHTLCNGIFYRSDYVDEGRSGLGIKGRQGLITLIEDVQSGNADFDHILVYDVSQWERFQDVDESAHCEFLCKRNGIKVAYCAEQFDKTEAFFQASLRTSSV